MSQNAAETITKSTVTYLTSKAPIVLILSQLAGGACDGASIMVGARSGVITRLKVTV